nr:LysE family translocator [Rhodospirillaceae bacterium]
GMCMTVAQTLGMSVGLRRTAWMMMGELVGVALVATAAVIGVAAVMTQYPAVFAIVKYLGGAYLGWLGLQLWRSRGSLALSLDENDASPIVTRRELATQGFITAIANPKGWAFMVALLPPFIDSAQAMVPQLVTLLAAIIVIEAGSMTLYAAGGRTLRKFLQHRSNVRLLNRIAGTLMFSVGIWLAFG